MSRCVSFLARLEQNATDGGLNEDMYFLTSLGAGSLRSRPRQGWFLPRLAGGCLLPVFTRHIKPHSPILEGGLQHMSGVGRDTIQPITEQELYR